MAGMLELSDQEFTTTMIIMPRALLDKTDSIHEQMGNVKERDGKPKKEPGRNARSKDTVTGMENAFGGPISRVDSAEERISQPEDKARESLKTKWQRQQKPEKTI